MLEYFGDVEKHVGAALKSRDAAELRATYRLAGNICKHCAHAIYVQVSELLSEFNVRARSV